MPYVEGFVIACPTNHPMPFDGKRLIFGGFVPVVDMAA